MLQTLSNTLSVLDYICGFGEQYSSKWKDMLWLVLGQNMMYNYVQAE